MFKNKYLAYLRDLGGLKTEDGLLVKSGVIFRSSDLSEITKEESKDLYQEINVGHIIDLRTNEEIAISPDVIPDGVIYDHIPLMSNEDNPAVTKKTRTAVLKRRMKEPGGMAGHITSIYPLIVSSEMSISGLKNIFNILMNKNDDKSVVYHCTQGKDRTGMVSTLILSALGVKKETIIEDYLKFNNFHRMKRFWIFVGMTIVFLSVKTAKELNSALTARREYILAAFKEIETKWGNALNYIKEVIGLSDNDINKLRSLYLVRA